MYRVSNILVNKAGENELKIGEQKKENQQKEEQMHKMKDNFEEYEKKNTEKIENLE